MNSKKFEEMKKATNYMAEFYEETMIELRYVKYFPAIFFKAESQLKLLAARFIDRLSTLRALRKHYESIMKAPRKQETSTVRAWKKLSVGYNKINLYGAHICGMTILPENHIRDTPVLFLYFN